MTDSQTSPDDQRDPALNAAMDDCLDFITRRFALLIEATGQPVQFHLISMTGEHVEHAGQISDFDMMADAFGDLVNSWMEEGLCAEEPGDDDPLFTATFDPAKARLS